MKAYLLGIDIGTSACKVAVFRRDGKVVASAAKNYPVYYPKLGYAEQNPQEWWEAVCLAIKEIIYTGNIQPEEIAGVGIAGQSWSAIAIDKQGTVLTNTPIWMDTRAEDICKELRISIGADSIYELSGNSLQSSYSTAKILWYQRYMPEVYNKIDKILQSNSFIAYRLTDVITQDKSQGYGLHCYNMRQQKWDETMCSKLGIPMEFLPDIVDCHHIVGTVTKQAALECGLAKGTPVAAGGLDAACGTLGAGVIHNGETQEQGGQAGGMSICLDTYIADPSLILSSHVVPGKWLLQGGTTGGGGVLRWVERELADYEREVTKGTDKNSFDLLNDLANKINPGSDGVIFLPYMSGERSPIWDPNAKGVFYGLDFNKTKGHLVRAAMEGVAFSLKHNLITAEKCNANVEVLRAMGGSANSLLWTQIKADITNKEILVPVSDTATTLGAAILAGVGVGFYKDFEEAVDITVKIIRKHTPNMELKKVYNKNYELYLELYHQLKNTMKK